MFRVKIITPAAASPYKLSDGREGVTFKQEGRVTFGENTSLMTLKLHSIEAGGTVGQEYDLSPDSFAVEKGNLVVRSKVVLVPASKLSSLSRPAA